jgi:hypothetical protein
MVHNVVLAQRLLRILVYPERRAKRIAKGVPTENHAMLSSVRLALDWDCGRWTC